MTGSPDRPGRALAVLALVLLVPVQGLTVVAMLFAFEGATGTGIAAAGRAWMAAFPIAWTVFVEGRRPAVRGPSRRGVLEGLAAGLLIGVVMLGAFATARGSIDLGPLRAKAAETGFDRPGPFAAIFVYIVLINPLLEEYVWRWFVFRELERALPPSMAGAPAVLGCAALFTAHHVIQLSAWVGPGLTALGSLGVFLGGVIWSTLYARHRSLWPAILSHAIADAAVLLMAVDLIFGPTVG